MLPSVVGAPLDRAMNHKLFQWIGLAVVFTSTILPRQRGRVSSACFVHGRFRQTDWWESTWHGPEVGRQHCEVDSHVLALQMLIDVVVRMGAPGIAKRKRQPAEPA